MRFAVLLMAVCLCVPGYARSRHKSASSSKAHGSSASSKKHSAARSGHGRRTRTQAHRSRPQYQAEPTPERYQEIQKALADKGYYKGPVNGVWGADSVDALRRFQTDQKIDGDGKRTAKSLILLGLGSKHGPVAKVTPPPENSPVQTTPPESIPNDHRSSEGSKRP